MSKEEQQQQVHTLVEYFKEQLRGVLEECSSSARRAPLVHYQRSDGTYITDHSEVGRRTKILSKEVYSHLHEVYGAVGVLSSCLKRDSHSSRILECENMEEPDVVICGPPGTEPGPGMSIVHMERNESLVYSRSSTALSSKSSSLQNFMIPAKDIPKGSCEVGVCVPEEGIRAALRCTRARRNMFRAPKKIISYSESETDSNADTTSPSDLSESEEETTTRLTEGHKVNGKRRHLDRPQATHRLAKPPHLNVSPVASDSDETVALDPSNSKGGGENLVHRNLVQRSSSFVSDSDGYETAREDLSKTNDNLSVGDGDILSFCDEPSTGSHEEDNAHPLSCSVKSKPLNGDIPSTGKIAGSEDLSDSDDDSIENSGIYRVMKEIFGNKHSEGENQSGKGKYPLNGMNGLSKKSGDAHTRLKRHLAEAKSATVNSKKRKSSIASRLGRRQPLVRLNRVALSSEQVKKAHQIIQASMNSDSVPKLPIIKSKENSPEIEEEIIVDVIGEDMIYSDLDDASASSNNTDAPVQKQEDEKEEDAPLSTPISKKPLSKRALSLSLPKKPASSEKWFATPNVQGIRKNSNLSLSSAKRKLLYTKSQMWSSDSDFDSTPLSQNPSQKVAANLCGNVRQTKKESSSTSTPVLKRKKILSSYSSGEEEVTPSFLQKRKEVKVQTSRKEGRGEDAELENEAFDDNGGEFDNDDGVESENKVQSSGLSYKKLGKYVKSPAGKGKEKATKKSSSTLPEKIDCAACGNSIYWKTKKIHAHPRLSVLVCQKCHIKFNQGTFQIEDENEIYCTLCGEGGDLVLCSFSQHSFCRECIKRHSGESHLNCLLSSDDVDFKCYVCDPSDIKSLQNLCEEVCYHFKAASKSNRQRKVKSKKYVIDSDTSTIKSLDNSTDGHEFSDEGGGGGGVANLNRGQGSLGGDTRSDGESSKRRGRSGGRKQLNESGRVIDSSSDYASNMSSTARGGEEKTKSSSKSQREHQSGKNDKSKISPSKKGSTHRQKSRSGAKQTADDDGSSSSDFMSDDGDSSVVDTDEISISDSSLFDDDGTKKKKRLIPKRKYNKRDDSEKRDLKEKRDKKSRKSRKKKKRIIVGHLHDSILSRSDFDDSDSESESILEKSRPAAERKSKKRKLSSSESKSKPSRKRGRLGSALSSGSGSSDEERLVVDISDTEGDGDNENDRLFGDILSEDEDSLSIRYVTPVKMNSRVLEDSSDSDVTPLRRINKKAESARKFFGSTSSVEKDEAENTSQSKEKVKVYKTRSRKRKNRENGSSDDFMSDDLSLRGPRFHSKHKRLRLASFLSSSESSSEEGSSGSTSKKKRKNKSKEDGDKSGGTPGTPGHKRKNIRKLISDEKLAKTTRTAQKEEEERLERLKEKARLLAPIEDSERIILEVDPKTKKAKVEIRDTLVRSLKPHQKEGIKFMYDSCIESLERFNQGKGQTNGAILAHCMGLGKTLQVIAFVDSLLNCEESGIKHVLVLSPINAIHNWMNEFRHWIPLMECNYGVYILREVDTPSRLKKLRNWQVNGGVILIGYEMYRNLAEAKKIKKKASREELGRYLLDPGPDMIVCDEGHILRNSKSNLSIVLGRVRTHTRIVLTGTPLQNNLLEYYTMVNFVKPNLLGTQREFTNRFANPIKNGQCRDSIPLDIRKMKQRAHVLHTLLQGSVQRRDYRVLADHLPPKQEYVLNIRMSPIQDQLCRRFLEKTRGIFLPTDLFSTYSTLSKVWNHPWVLKLDEDRQLEKAERLAMYGESDTEDDDSLDGFIVNESDETNSTSSSVRKTVGRAKSGRRTHSVSSRSSSVVSSRSATPSARQAAPTCIIISSDDSTDSETSKKKDPVFVLDGVVKREATSTDGVVTTGDAGGPSTSTAVPRRPPKEKTPPPWYDDLLSDDSINKIDLSGKLLFLLELLKEAEKLKEKVLVFSQSLLTLDLIEEFIGKEENGDWTPGLDYYRLDGSTNAQMRMANMLEFNKAKNNRLRLFLISTRAGSLGVNLVGANRVVIFDACWNPSHDLQAIFRTYRYGQTKPIFVYRLLAQGTMEEKIYDRQVTKQSLSMRVVDEKQIGRHFTASDLAELFIYSPAPPPGASNSDKPIRNPEEDMVLSSILDHMHPQWIVSYHEHDSLLEHVFDEELSEEERKAAWESYNSQKSAETARYNIEALQAKLQRDEEMQRAIAQNFSASTSSTVSQLAQRVAAQQQTIHSLQQHGNQMGNNPSGLAQIVVMNIDHTLHKIAELRSLQQTKSQIVSAYNSSSIPKPLADNLRQIDTKIQQEYMSLSKLIQFSNDSIVQFNHSPAAQVPRLLNIVSVKRQDLNNQLELLKNHKAPSSSGPSTSQDKQSKIVHAPTVAAETGSPAVLAAESLKKAANVLTSLVSKSSTGHDKAPHTEKVRLDGRAQSSTVAGGTSGSAGSLTQVRERIKSKLYDRKQEQQMREKAKVLLTEKTKAPADSTLPPAAPNPNQTTPRQLK